MNTIKMKKILCKVMHIKNIIQKNIFYLYKTKKIDELE
jgi:hypothetical protein